MSTLSTQYVSGYTVPHNRARNRLESTAFRTREHASDETSEYISASTPGQQGAAKDAVMHVLPVTYARNGTLENGKDAMFPRKPAQGFGIE